MYAIRACMYHSNHKYTTLHVFSKGFHEPLESCMLNGLSCTTRVISIVHCKVVARVFMYLSSHVCDMGFCVPPESQVYYTACLLEGFPCTTRVMYAIRAFMYHLSHKYSTLHVFSKGFHEPSSHVCDKGFHVPL